MYRYNCYDDVIPATILVCVLLCTVIPTYLTIKKIFLYLLALGVINCVSRCTLCYLLQ